MHAMLTHPRRADVAACTGAALPSPPQLPSLLLPFCSSPCLTPPFLAFLSVTTSPYPHPVHNTLCLFSCVCTHSTLSDARLCVCTQPPLFPLPPLTATPASNREILAGFRRAQPLNTADCADQDHHAMRRAA
eukprot:1402539-Rhodomonas_salina.2